MVKRAFVLIVIILMGIVLLPFLSVKGGGDDLNVVASKYVTDGPAELGGQNIVTSVIVTYRGLDTLGEVLVLFIATTGVGFLLRKRKNKNAKRPASELLKTGSLLLLPLILLLGVYVFINGHLTPGGGFQGGVIVATGFLLMMLAWDEIRFKAAVIRWMESISGAGYLLIGLLGLLLGAGFLDSRLLPLGQYGQLFSAGTIPLIYSLIGLKVGTELVSILDNLRGEE